MKIDTEQLLINCIRNRELLPEPTMGLQAILKAEGMERYAAVCVNRIRNADLVDEQSIVPDLMSSADLLFTSEGLGKAYDILLGYIEKSKLTQYKDYLEHCTNVFGNINRQSKQYRLIDSSMLRRMKKGDYMGYTFSAKTEASMKKMAAEELNARKIHNTLIRFLSKLFTEIRVSLKCRLYLILFGNTQNLGR